MSRRFRVLRHGRRAGGAWLLLLPAALGASPPATDDSLARIARGCSRSKAAVLFQDGHSRCRACFDGDALSYIEERPATGAAIRYYYASGQLSRGRFELAPGATGGGPGAQAGSVPAAIDWNAGGEATRAVRLEHYGEIRLDAQTIATMRGRGLALATAALAARGVR